MFERFDDDIDPTSLRDGIDYGGVVFRPDNPYLAETTGLLGQKLLLPATLLGMLLAYVAPIIAAFLVDSRVLQFAPFLIGVAVLFLLLDGVRPAIVALVTAAITLAIICAPLLAAGYHPAHFIFGITAGFLVMCWISSSMVLHQIHVLCQNPMVPALFRLTLLFVWRNRYRAWDQEDLRHHLDSAMWGPDSRSGVDAFLEDYADEIATLRRNTRPTALLVVAVLTLFVATAYAGIQLQNPNKLLVGSGVMMAVLSGQLLLMALMAVPIFSRNKYIELESAWRQAFSSWLRWSPNNADEPGIYGGMLSQTMRSTSIVVAVVLISAAICHSAYFFSCIPMYEQLAYHRDFVYTYYPAEWKELESKPSADSHHVASAFLHHLNRVPSAWLRPAMGAAFESADPVCISALLISVCLAMAVSLAIAFTWSFSSVAPVLVSITDFVVYLHDAIHPDEWSEDS